MKTPRGEIVMAKDAAVVGDRTVRKGETFWADDPLVVSHRQLFEPFEVENPRPEKPKR